MTFSIIDQAGRTNGSSATGGSGWKRGRSGAIRTVRHPIRTRSWLSTNYSEDYDGRSRARIWDRDGRDPRGGSSTICCPEHIELHRGVRLPAGSADPRTSALSVTVCCPVARSASCRCWVRPYNEIHPLLQQGPAPVAIRRRLSRSSASTETSPFRHAGRAPQPADRLRRTFSLAEERRRLLPRARATCPASLRSPQGSGSLVIVLNGAARLPGHLRISAGVAGRRSVLAQRRRPG